MRSTGIIHPRRRLKIWSANGVRIAPLLGIGALLLSPVLGQPGPAVRLTRLSGEIVLDGVINEAAWQTVAPLAMLESYPNFGNEPSERTELIIVQNWFEELKRLVPTDN